MLDVRQAWHALRQMYFDSLLFIGLPEGRLAKTQTTL